MHLLQYLKFLHNMNLSIFSENLSKFRYLLKEGNLLIFDIDKTINNNEARYIIRSNKKLDSRI